MPIAEIFTAVKVIEACFCGVIGNRIDAGVISAGMACVRQMTDPQLPKNHHVLNAMHQAFAKSIGIMALACDAVGGSAEDHFSRRALQRLARSAELKALNIGPPAIPIPLLEERVRAIYGDAAKSPKQAATETVIALIEDAMGDVLTGPLREVFRSGHGRYTNWAESFELFFAADVKANTALFRILSLDRQNELIARADEAGELLHQLTDDIAEFRAEVRANHAEVMGALAQLQASVNGGEIAPSAAIEILARAARDGKLTDEQRSSLATIYAEFLDATTEIPAPLIEAAKRQLAEADDPELLDATLRNMAGEQRKALIAETETRVDHEVRAAASRYRRLASFAALESLADGIRLYRKALSIEQDDFSSWIELSRLYSAAGNLGEQQRCASQSLQHVSSDRERGVAENDLGNAAIIAGNLKEARRHFENWHSIAERLAAQEPGNTGRQRDLTVSYNKLGDVEVASGNLGAARARYEAGLAIRERLAAQEPGNTEWQRDLTVSYSKLGDVEVASGNLGAARARYEAGLAIAERLAAQEPGNAEWQRDLTVSYTKLGDVEMASGNLGVARARFEAGLAIAERLAVQEPGNTEWQRDLTVSYERLGDVEVASGNLGAARARYEAGLAIRERLAAQEPGNTGWQRDLTVSYNKLGDVEVASGNLGAARARVEASLAIRERLATQEPGNTGWQRDLYVGLDRLARVAVTEGDIGAAIAHYRRTETIMAALVAHAPDHPGFAEDLANIRVEIARLSA